MAKDSDISVSLPSPPPPRPAARRDAIEAALRKFDGIEETAERPSRIKWGSMNRRPAGALVAATLIAIVAIPAMQIALRDQSAEEATESGDPAPARSDREASEAVSESPQAPADATVASRASPTQPSPSPPAAAEERAGPVMADSDRISEVAESIPVAAPPPPPAMAAAPPPPPPSPAPEPEAAGDGLVVTGSRIRRSDLAKQNGFAQRAEEPASPLAILDAYDIFLSRLQYGLRSNDRRAVVRLVALPLRVNLAGERKTYRSSRDIERDFDRIFTPAVRQAIFNLGPDTLTSRDGGRLKGNARIWLGCLNTVCASDDLIRIREITP